MPGDTRSILEQAEINAIADRLRLAAEHIYAERKVPPPATCESITQVVTDSEWFRDLCLSTMTRPLVDLMFGCILFGYQLNTEYHEIKEKERPIYRA